MDNKKKMTRQEIISRIIELEMIVTEAVSKGHMAHTQDEYQPYREELKVLRQKINFMSEVRVIEDLSKYEDYLTVGKLRKFLEKHASTRDSNEKSHDILFLGQRIPLMDQKGKRKQQLGVCFLCL